MAKTFIPATDFKFEFAPANQDDALAAAGAFTDDKGRTFVPAENLVEIPGYNMRVQGKGFEARVAFLEEQMLKNGYDLARPMTVFSAMIDGKPCIALHDGFHRKPAVIRANAKLVGKKKIAGVPIEFKEDINYRKLMIGLLSANSGEPPAPYEAAIVARRLLNDGMSPKDIAAELSITRRWVDDLLLLATATPRHVNALIANEVSATTLIEELRNYSPEDAEKRFLAAQAKLIANSEGKRKVTAKSLKDAGVAKKKEKRKTSVASTSMSKTPVMDFIALHTSMVEAAGEGPVPYMEIAYAAGVGYAAVILETDRITNPDAATICEGVGESAEIACHLACEAHTNAMLDDAAADL